MSETNHLPPEWLRRVSTLPPSDTNSVNPVLLRRAPSGVQAREAAVLVLFGGSPEADPIAVGGLPEDADLLLLQRASTLRQHGGQIAFPGGASDPEDDGPVGTALREAEEETGLDPAGVRTLAVLPGIFVPPSGFDVTPVIGYWDRPTPVRAVDLAETERVARVPMRTLLDPDNRFQVRHRLGYQGPAFLVDDMLVWGFTAGVLAGLIAISGWEIEWDRSDIRDLEVALAEVEAGIVEVHER
ncbi:8-oxo-dGTP pyrophosphatase MutT (NUDIX family) [Rhodococcus sp. PvR044]|nr:8-oxo-dGTP pyrophosphatase MutT (NUDIX family) [Rhodococcus sp. PvR099]PTR39924.1 ADP-ribose pyrophosphatase YjhB (NUDIX family) [Rhodococcus sp. OK611]SNX92391.1 ADP-ribose pyrophosphatase YjhB, NUDIX family [Rhodococcus sp. OK270]